MGRQSWTWNHPTCFLSNLTVAVEGTGRGKCKASGKNLEKDCPKIGLRSHTNTAWVGLDCAAEVLAPVFQVADVKTLSSSGNSDGDKPMAMDGFVALAPEHAEAVTRVLKEAAAGTTAPKEEEDEESVTEMSEPVSSENQRTRRNFSLINSANFLTTVVPLAITQAQPV